MQLIRGYHIHLFWRLYYLLSTSTDAIFRGRRCQRLKVTKRTDILILNGFKMARKSKKLICTRFRAIWRFPLTWRHSVIVQIRISLSWSAAAFCSLNKNLGMDVSAKFSTSDYGDASPFGRRQNRTFRKRNLDRVVQQDIIYASAYRHATTCCACSFRESDITRPYRKSRFDLAACDAIARDDRDRERERESPPAHVWNNLCCKAAEHSNCNSLCEHFPLVIGSQQGRD